LTLALLLAFAFAVAVSARAEAATPAALFTLGNGMEVVVVPDHRVPVVTHVLWFKVGGAEDPPDQPGVAHFLEHMMFRGTAKFPGNSFDRFIVALVGEIANAGTSGDYTRYPQRLPKQKLGGLMELEADRMVNLEIREEHVKLEIGAVLNERRGNELSPLFPFRERMYATRFPDHPYGRSVLGSVADIKALDRTKTLAFYQRFYAPNNAILVVAGDVTESEVRALAEKTYGRVPAREVPERVIHALPDRTRTERVEFEHEQVTTPSVGFYYTTVGAVATPRADAHALSLFSHIVGTSIIGRLHRRLVTEQHLAMSVSCSYSLEIQAGTLAFAASAAPGVPIADVEQALATEIAALARDGVTEAELDDARRSFLAAKAYDDDNHVARAMDYGLARVWGLAIAELEAADRYVAQVTAADINRLAAEILGKSQPVIGVMRPLSVQAGPSAPQLPSIAR
jgi:zinc protease